jgi:hypothetical protein
MDFMDNQLEGCRSEHLFNAIDDHNWVSLCNEVFLPLPSERLILNHRVVAKAYPAQQSAAEFLYRTLQSRGSLLLAGTISHPPHCGCF